MASSSFNVPRRKYDVFISFRGEDTRRGIVSHLLKALKDEKIEAFSDYNLKEGNEISPVLLKAIEESYVSLVIFSKGYANSKWCLEELEKIIDSMERYKQIIIPIFYDVDPSTVRYQKRCYEDAFTRHEKFGHNSFKIERWRTSLKKVANLSGIDSSKFETDAELVEKIVDCVRVKMKNIMLQNDSTELIGSHERIKELELLLCKRLQDVEIIGIWGMGGIGKTTMASLLFKKLSHGYEGYYILENVRKQLGKYEKTELKNKLISKLLGEDLDITMPVGLPDHVQLKLHRKKVLVVLDDVDDPEQIKDLTGAYDWFGQGSTIIVTSRDKNVLSKYCSEIYEVKALNFEQSLQLFSLHASKEGCLKKEGSDELSLRAIDYVKGNPLALKVLGSYLHDKCEAEWRDELAKLQNMPIPKIQDVLRLSYDALDQKVKDVFLYIACALKGFYKVDIISLLQSSLHPTIGLRDLQDKALITISSNGEVSMHDLIQEMARQIVREESPNDPGKRRHLWDQDEIYKVLKNNLGTGVIESISLQSWRGKEIQLDPKAFKKMVNLKIFKFQCRYGLLMSDKIHNSLPKELNYFKWEVYPSNSPPSKVCLKILVENHMRDSTVERLWDESQDLGNSKQIDLFGSRDLEELPDKSMASKHKIFDLSFCFSLHLDHPSTLSNHNLLELILFACQDLQRTHVWLSLLPQLNSLLTVVKKFHLLTTFGLLNSLRVLNFSQSNVVSWPESIKHLRNLEQLCLRCCSRLRSIPELPPSIRILDVSYCISLESLFTSNFSMAHLPNLRYLYLRGCSRLRSIPELPPSIRILDVSYCISLETLFTSNFSMAHFPNLEHLYLRGCSRLRSIPELPPSIKILDVSYCISLETLFTSNFSMVHLPNLRYLCLLGCSRLRSIPELPPSIRILDVSYCISLENLFTSNFSMAHFPNLEYLYLRGCSRLRSIPELPPSIRILDVSYCISLETLFTSNFSMAHFPNLEHLYLRGCSRLRSIPELPPSIRILDASYCASLETLFTSNFSMAHLPNLEHLCLGGCSRLRSIPELPPSIRILDVSYCTSLETLFTSNFSMAHLPNLEHLYLLGCSSVYTRASIFP